MTKILVKDITSIVGPKDMVINTDYDNDLFNPHYCTKYSEAFKLFPNHMVISMESEAYNDQDGRGWYSKLVIHITGKVE